MKSTIKTEIDIGIAHLGPDESQTYVAPSAFPRWPFSGEEEATASV